MPSDYLVSKYFVIAIDGFWFIRIENQGDAAPRFRTRPTQNGMSRKIIAATSGQNICSPFAHIIDVTPGSRAHHDS